MPGGACEIVFVYSFNNHDCKPESRDLEASQSFSAFLPKVGMARRIFPNRDIEISGLTGLIEPATPEHDEAITQSADACNEKEILRPSQGAAGSLRDHHDSIGVAKNANTGTVKKNSRIAIDGDATGTPRAL